MVKGILTQNNQLKAFLMMLFKSFPTGIFNFEVNQYWHTGSGKKNQNSTAKHGGKYISVSKSVGL